VEQRELALDIVAPIVIQDEQKVLLLDEDVIELLENL